MYCVSIILNKSQLRKCFAKYSNIRSPITILNLSQKVLPTIRENSGLIVKELRPRDVNKVSSDQFLKDYRDLIGQVSLNLSSRDWWATNIASKNRFNSRIPILLEQVEACSIASGQGIDNLIIYQPDFAIVSTLQKLFDDSRYTSNIDRIRVKCKLQKDRIRFFAYHLYNFFAICRRLLLCRVYYNNRLFLDKNSAKPTYLLKTFFYESTIDENNKYNYKDPMFGRLPRFLSTRGNLYMLTHILGKYKI